jgi:hypothetical protein
MSRGLGRIERECLRVIEVCEERGIAATTLKIAVNVYRVERDRRGIRVISVAEHTGTKRALASLRRKGLIKGHQALAERPDGRIMLARCKTDGRAQRCCYWSTPTSPDLATSVAADPNWMKSNASVAVMLGMSVSTVRRGRAKARAEALTKTA